ncbi:MAG: PP2C family protein-serine/threonine phosphatase [bacterium]|nr:PP2C family protein-serine/threonine phosphatase [bacterium]
MSKNSESISKISVKTLVNLHDLELVFMTSKGNSVSKRMTEKDILEKLSPRELLSIIKAYALLNSVLDYDELFKIIMRMVTYTLSSERSSLFIIDEEKQVLKSIIAQGKVNTEIIVPVGQGLAGYAAKTGDILYIDDCYKCNKFDKSYDRTTGFKTRDMLVSPLKNKEGKIIGVIQVMNKKNGKFTEYDMLLLKLLSTQIAIAIENAKLYKESLAKQKIDDDLQIAKDIQKQLLPQVFPEFEYVDIWGANIPAREVGGDYFDFYHSEKYNSIYFAIADITGKGISAALLVSMLKAVFRSEINHSEDLEKISLNLNNFIVKNTPPEKFITFFLGKIELENQTLNYINAGHNYPYFIRNNILKPLKTGGLPFGLFENISYQVNRIKLQKNDLLFMYTDGITESQNRRYTQFGEVRLKKILKRINKDKIKEIGDLIMGEIVKFTGDFPQFDDQTILLVRVKK